MPELVESRDAASIVEMDFPFENGGSSSGMKSGEGVDIGFA